ncbi:MAG: hypothetical protein WDZ59_08050 [Pirellulales bacterium]
MPRSLAALVLAALSVGLAGPARSQEEPLLAPQEGVVLLRNQNVLRGKISKAGDYYFVVVPDGEIRLRSWQVDAVCSSLDEVYRIKSEGLPLGRIDGHLELAEWCLRERLYGYAGEQILHARQLDPMNLRVGLLERRLRNAVAEPADPPQIVASRLPAETLSRKMLDEMVRELPSAAMADFTGRIQPLLVNRCATAGCHGPGAESEFRLERIPADRVYSRRLSQRNLHAVLKMVDREQPAASPLLKLPGQPHGSLKEPVFAQHERDQFLHMVDWVHLVSQRPVDPMPDSVATASPLLQTVPNAPATGVADASQPRGPQTPSVTPADFEQALPGSVDQSQHPEAATEDTPQGAAQRFVPRDSFDPAIFNRRYSKRALQTPR